jgi:hypothetical protein
MTTESQLKKFIQEQTPGHLLNFGCKLRSLFRHADYAAKSPSVIFSEIFRNKRWGGSSYSGMGSDLRQTESVRRHLIPLLEEYGLDTILDLPCGDFYWMKMVDLGKRRYLGGDLVEELIRANQYHYGSENRRFVVLDLQQDQLPDADLILCRDCLIHLSNGDIFKSLKNIQKSQISYLLTTSYPLLKRNTDILTGDFRAINLLIPPFNFPPPLAVIPEDPFLEQKDNPNFIRELCLWRVADLKVMESSAAQLP